MSHVKRRSSSNSSLNYFLLPLVRQDGNNTPKTELDIREILIRVNPLILPPPFRYCKFKKHYPMPVERKLKEKQIEINRVPVPMKQTVSVHFERNSCHIDIT